MKLYLLQHGEALAKEIDPDRPLSDRGRADVTRLAALLETGGLHVARILHSGKTRARQSADILASAIGCEAVSARDGLAPNDPPETLAEALVAEGEDTILAGHLPFMARLVDHLLGGQDLVAYRPGSLVALERDEAGDWQLSWMLRPELL
ncbi:MAG: phosphohistidine phosphatase SixA [Pseudomonadota bacterium]